MAEALVHALFESDTRGLDEMLEVIYSYSHFVTPEALLDALASHFRGISSSQAKPQGETIMLRIINFLKNWIKVEQKLFLTNPALDDLLKKFLQELPPKWVPVLEMALNDKAEKEAEESDGDPTEQKPPVLTRKPSKATFSVITITILNYDAEEVARQLVLIDLQYCQKVDPKEFLNASWTKPASTATPLGLNECAVRANAVAYWVAQQVLTCPTLKARVKLLTHILLISQSLLKYQNFQSLMTFYLGLNLGPVEDLDLFSNLPKNVAEIWRDIKFLFDVASNFRNYRQKIKSINLPYILCQEILLKDLLYLEESQTDFIDDIFGRFVNQEKMYTIGKTIHSFVKSQRCSYGLSDYPELQEFLRTSPDMSELLNSLTSIELKVNFCENRTKEPSLRLTKPPEPTFGPSSPNSSQLSSYSGEDSSLHIEEMKNLSPTNSSRITSPRRPRSIRSLFSDGPTSPRSPRNDHPTHSLERSFTSPAKSRSPAPISPKLSLTNTNSMSERTESCEEEEHKSKSGVVTRIRSRSLSSKAKGKNSTNAPSTVIRSSPALSYTVSSEKSPFGPLPQSRPLSTSLKERRERDKESASESPKERASNSNSPDADKRRERSKKKLTRDDSERGEKERFEAPKKTNSSPKSLPKKKSPDQSLALLGLTRKSDGKIEKPDDSK